MRKLLALMLALSALHAVPQRGRCEANGITIAFVIQGISGGFLYRTDNLPLGHKSLLRWSWEGAMDDDLSREVNDLARELEHLTPDPELKTDLAKLLGKYGRDIGVLKAQVEYLMDKVDQLVSKIMGTNRLET